MVRIAAPNWLISLIVASAACAPAASVAQDISDNFVAHTLRQIICQYPPDATVTLIYLRQKKRIDVKQGQRVDGETCWPLSTALPVAGLSFTHICASTEDPLLMQLFPRLYYRGPGTSPGTGLRLVTDETEATVNDWIGRAKEQLGVRGETKVKIGAPAHASGKTEISCNSTSFGSGE